jgi:hypothetical protein
MVVGTATQTSPIMARTKAAKRKSRKRNSLGKVFRERNGMTVGSRCTDSDKLLGVPGIKRSPLFGAGTRSYAFDNVERLSNLFTLGDALVGVVGPKSTYNHYGRYQKDAAKNRRNNPDASRGNGRGNINVREHSCLLFGQRFEMAAGRGGTKQLELTFHGREGIVCLFAMCVGDRIVIRGESCEPEKRDYQNNATNNIGNNLCSDSPCCSIAVSNLASG